MVPSSTPLLLAIGTLSPTNTPIQPSCWLSPDSLMAIAHGSWHLLRNNTTPQPIMLVAFFPWTLLSHLKYQFLLCAPTSLVLYTSFSFSTLPHVHPVVAHSHHGSSVTPNPHHSPFAAHASHPSCQIHNFLSTWWHPPPTTMISTTSNQPPLPTFLAYSTYLFHLLFALSCVSQLMIKPQSC